MDFDDTLETEHDVFSDFTGVVSGTNDNLDTINVEGSPALKISYKDPS
jgi:hypothetical protein